MFIPCRKCSNKKGPEPGYFYVKVKGFDAVQECNCHINWRKKEDLARRAKESNVYTSLTFDDYKGNTSRTDLTCLRKIADNPQRFLDKGAMIYIYGPNGTQKTTMVKVLGYNLLKQDYKVFYIRMNDLIQTIIDAGSFNEIESSQARNTYKKLIEADFLLVDESFDKSKITLFKSGYQIPYLDNFIRERYEDLKKPIIFISNIKPQDIDEGLFGKSLKDLINRSTGEAYLEFYDKFALNAVNISRKALFD